MKNWLQGKTVLLTGGTSGLGKSLLVKLLANGCSVISVSRNGILQEIDSDNYRHISSDFSDMASVKKLIDKLIEDKVSVDVLINNAGVLSPPRYEETKDGFELSYQVNFLAHVYLTRLLLKNKVLNPKLIVNTSSPIHSRGHLNLEKALDPNKYGLLQAYSNTKLYMALHSDQVAKDGYQSFSFNPGTFNSGIYRLQEKWFHILYKVAAPFMASSDNVANGLFKTIHDQSWESGKMMNKRGKQSKMLQHSTKEIENFWAQVDQQLSGL